MSCISRQLSNYFSIFALKLQFNRILEWVWLKTIFLPPQKIYEGGRVKIIHATIPSAATDQFLLFTKISENFPSFGKRYSFDMSKNFTISFFLNLTLLSPSMDINSRAV